MKTIAIQGIRGAFHEEAAKLYFREELQIIPKLEFEELVEAVEKKQCDFGILAIENTISGTINQNLRLLTDHKVWVCGEVKLRIVQNLGALPGTSIDQLSEVRSHYMAINQCRDYFKNYPQIKLVNDTDTALSVKDVAEKNLQGVGAIGSSTAMELYGLDTIATSIETVKSNFTRFFIIVPELAETKPGSYNKISLTMMLPHAKGSLSRVLNLFVKHDINLSKIESIPVVGQPYHYQFVLDMELGNNAIFESMTGALEKLVENYKILGMYQSHEMHMYETCA